MTYEEFRDINNLMNESRIRFADAALNNLCDRERALIPTIQVSREQLNFVRQMGAIITIGLNEQGSPIEAYDLFGQFVFLKVKAE